MKNIGTTFDSFLKSEGILTEVTESAILRKQEYIKSLKDIYIVQGMTGSYEDVYTWDVFAFYDKEKAENYLKLLKNEFEQLSESFSLYDYENNEESKINNENLKRIFINYGMPYRKSEDEENVLIFTLSKENKERLEKEYPEILEDLYLEIDEKEFEKYRNLYDNGATICFNEGIRYSLKEELKIIE